MPKISLIIPTKNEEKNIEKTIKQSIKALQGEDFELIVIDSSKDKTPKIVKRIVRENTRIKLAKQKGNGLGAAYKQGFNKAKGNILVQMDADLSHNPRDIKRLVKTVKQGADIAIGSRYLSNGKRADSMKRRIAAKTGSWLFRALLGIKAKDITSGFRAISKKALNGLEIEKMPNGFAFQEALLVELLWRGAKAEEVAISFNPRKHGKSNFSIAEMVSVLWLLLKLFKKRLFGSANKQWLSAGLG